MLTSVIVGTGFGGISAALALKGLNIDDFIMLERRSFAGGTWLQNRYPGAAVDVQSPLYSLSGNPYPWSHLFAKQPEIAEYTNKILHKYKLNTYIELNSTVKEAKWSSDHWEIELNNGRVILAKTLINATGPLSTPVIPEFKDMSQFKGRAFHCNDWPKDLSLEQLEDKRVAIIGSGASAVQIIPAIINSVKKLHVFQRTPHWILPGPDWTIPKRLKRFLAINPIYKLIRFIIYWSLELRVIAFKYSPRLLKLVGELPAKRHLKRQVRDIRLRDKLTPNFIIGCKRILISDTYYPALQHKNCALHDKNDEIIAFTESGILLKASGQIDVDIVVFATGYDAQASMVSYPVTGKHHQSLSDYWKDYPRAYLGTTVPNFPNFFIVTGPNTGIGHTSAIYVIESQIKYIEHCIKLLKKREIKSIEPTEYAEQSYTDMIHREMQRTVWSYGGCKSWYQNKQGKVIAMFPGFSFVFRRLCKVFKASDHSIAHHKN